MNRITLTLASLLGLSSLSAQQLDAPITQFQSTLIQTNPAMTGFRYKHEANILHHDQEHNKWNDYLGTNVNYAMRLDSINSGIGISYSFNRENEFRFGHLALLHYAYHFKWGQSALSLGVSGGVRILQFDYDWIPSQTMDDPLLPRGNYNSALTVNAGIAYRWKELNAGFSVTQANKPTFKDGDSDYSFYLDPNYWFFADYTIHLSPAFDLKPQFQYGFSENGFRHTLLFSVLASYMPGPKSSIFLGANYYPERYVGPMAGFGFQQFRITGSYNFSFNDLYYYFSPDYTSFEVGLSYRVK